MTTRAELDLYEEPLSGPLVGKSSLRSTIERWQNPPSSNPVTHRTLDGVPLCEAHTQACKETQFETDDTLRAVWADAEIKQRALDTGMREDDLRKLHGQFVDDRCAMCGVSPSENDCLNCGTSLPRQWPAVYCSNRCALDDA